MLAVHGVSIAAEIDIGFELAKIRQHTTPVPAFGTGARPVIVIGGRATQRHHAHHRTTAAEHTRLREPGRRGVYMRAPMTFEAIPEIRFIEIRRWIHAGDIGRLSARPHIAPCFKQQNRMRRTFSEAASNHATGGTAANDDGVEAGSHAGILTVESRVHAGRQRPTS